VTEVGFDRRFEAVIVVTDRAALEEAEAATIAELVASGMGIAIVSPLSLDRLRTSFAAVGPIGPGVLLLAGAGGTDLAVLHGVEVSSDAADDGGSDPGALLQAADRVAARLAELGLATAPGRRHTARSVALELVAASSTGGAWDGNGRLLAAGLSGPNAVIELATAAASEAGINHPRVAFSHGRITIAASHENDGIGWALGRLWDDGVAPAATLVLDNRQGSMGTPGEAADTVAFDGQTPTLVRADPLQRSRLLDDQARRRRRRELPAPPAEEGWVLAVDGFDADQERVREALLSLADGRIGTSGAPLAAHPNTRPWVLAAGIYRGDGPATRLLTGPVGLSLGFELVETGLHRRLDLRTGVLYEELISDRGPVVAVRLCSLARPGIVAVRAASPAPADGARSLLPPTDDPLLDQGEVDHASWMRVEGRPGGMCAAAISDSSNGVTDRMIAYLADPERLPEPDEAVTRVGAVSQLGFDRLLVEHRQAWAARWRDADIVIEGDDELQRAVRLALFHLMGSVGDTGEAAVGARGLSGPSYRGHVFWDADAFVLPCLAATHPASARAMLEYRIRRLPEALRAARAGGRSGARFPWESARTGRDVTPTSARDRSGRLLPIRTGQLEEHIVSDVAWAATCYVDWTGDSAFEAGPGLGLLVETARYWASRIRVDTDGNAHLYGVIGPDEYHQPVDDNAFTNVMARWNLRQAAQAVETLGAAAGGPDERELVWWRQLADALVDGYDHDTGIYEQFAGFHRLEPLIIKEVAPRLPIAADLLLGPDRVNGAQVVKQADVLMLHQLVPDEVAPGSLDPNLRFYEPRTAHGSSLSPGVHASLHARARDFPNALGALAIAARIDLDDLTGSTAGGLHLATMGALWQALVYGFGGLRPRDGRLQVDPRLPPEWAAWELRVLFRGSRIRVRKERGRMSIVADPPADVSVDSATFSVTPRGLNFGPQGHTWKVVP
jgi:trehalose/maltose hydrolase-like predicted phosphorylase